MYSIQMKNFQVQEQINANQAFFEQLGQANTEAIKSLAQKIRPNIQQSVKRAQLPLQDIEEIMNDAIIVTIKAIRKGSFEFQSYHPAAYAKGVAKKLIANRIRSKKPSTEALENVYLHSAFNPDLYLKDKERQAIVGQLLDGMCEGCRKILKLKYFHAYKDKEIIEQKLSPYTTINALKSKRSQCLKKLAVLAKKAGIREAF